ncbi:hypothetical protein KM043_004933 [Ampulex compressa]|nr:hypothetical protein KM043_004933 [Ampulex compressa]
MELTTTLGSICLLLAMTLVRGENDAERTFMPTNVSENDDVARVKIKVFRGPTQEKDGERFAPWGFWIKQPA